MEYWSDGLAVEGEGAGTADFEVHQLAVLEFRGFQNDDFSATGPASEAGGISLAGTFDQHLHLPTGTGLVVARAHLVDEGQKALVALFLDLLGNLVGHGRVCAEGDLAIQVSRSHAERRNCGRLGPKRDPVRKPLALTGESAHSKPCRHGGRGRGRSAGVKGDTRGAE